MVAAIQEERQSRLHAANLRPASLGPHVAAREEQAAYQRAARLGDWGSLVFLLGLRICT